MYESTVADHTAALLADPNDFTALVSRGNAYARQGDFDQGRRRLYSGVVAAARRRRVYRRRGLAHALTQAHEKAVADFTEAIR